MCKSSFDIVQWVGQLLQGIVVIVLLIIFIKVYEVDVAIIIVAALPLGTVAGKVPWLPTLKACITSSIAQGFLGVGGVVLGSLLSSSPSLSKLLVTVPSPSSVL